MKQNALIFIQFTDQNNYLIYLHIKKIIRLIRIIKLKRGMIPDSNDFPVNVFREIVTKNPQPLNLQAVTFLMKLILQLFI